VLSNEKYIGNNVYNRRSFKLKKVRVVNQPDMWIKKEGAFEGICWRHLNSDPPCRSNIDPGRIAEFGISNCG
jgi:hypothetical protein